MPEWYEPSTKRMSYILTLGWGLFFTFNLLIVFFVIYYLSDYKIGYITNIIYFLFALLSLYILKYTKQTWLAANIMAAIIFCNTTINSYFTGGLHSSILMWLLILPIVSIFILERTQGLLWVIASLLSLAYFYFYAPNGSPDSIILINDVHFDIWVNLFILLGVIWFSAVVFDNAKNQAIKDAQEARIEAHQNAMALNAELTKRQLAELALRKSEERLSLAINGADIGLWDWNINSGEITFNKKFAEILGYKNGEMEQTYQQWLRKSVV